MRKFYILIASLVMLQLPASVASADFYRYVDESGTVHITNVPSSSKYVWMMREKRNALRPSNKDGAGRRHLEDFIYVTSQRYGVDPSLVKAIVKAESDFNSTAVSNKGARGLMQLMPETANLMGVRDVHDPHENVEGGIRHLSRLLRMFGWKVNLAVAAYNAGESAVLKYGTVPPYSETRDYVKRVLYYYNAYRGETN